jgi:hypothetical protein
VLLVVVLLFVVLFLVLLVLLGVFLLEAGLLVSVPDLLLVESDFAVVPLDDLDLVVLDLLDFEELLLLLGLANTLILEIMLSNAVTENNLLNFIYKTPNDF